MADREQRRTRLAWPFVVLGIAAGLVGLVLTLVHLSTAAIIAFIVAAVLILIGIFRRVSRPGDFERSGWTG